MKRRVALAVATALAAAGLGTAQWAGASSTTPGTSTPTAGVRDGGTIVLDWNRALLRLVRTPGAQPATVHPTSPGGKRSWACTRAASRSATTST